MHQRRSTWIGVAVVGVVVAGLVALGLSVYFADRTEMGDCVTATGRSAKTSDFEVVDCDSPDAAYEIVASLNGGSCDSNTYGQWHVTANKGPGTTYCLILNADDGDCFHQTIGFPTGKATKVECGPAASYRVVSTHRGITDADTCGDDVIVPVDFDPARPMAFVYREPPLTICTDRA